jgi:hypothetical protein
MMYLKTHDMLRASFVMLIVKKLFSKFSSVLSNIIIYFYTWNCFLFFYGLIQFFKKHTTYQIIININ